MMDDLQKAAARLRELATERARILTAQHGDADRGTTTSDAFWDAVADFAETVAKLKQP